MLVKCYRSASGGLLPSTGCHPRSVADTVGLILVPIPLRSPAEAQILVCVSFSKNQGKDLSDAYNFQASYIKFLLRTLKIQSKVPWKMGRS